MSKSSCPSRLCLLSILTGKSTLQSTPNSFQNAARKSEKRGEHQKWIRKISFVRNRTFEKPKRDAARNQRTAPRFEYFHHSRNCAFLTPAKIFCDIIYFVLINKVLFLYKRSIFFVIIANCNDRLTIVGQN